MKWNQNEHEHSFLFIFHSNRSNKESQIKIKITTELKPKTQTNDKFPFRRGTLFCSVFRQKDTLFPNLQTNPGFQQNLLNRKKKKRWESEKEKTNGFRLGGEAE